MDTLFKNSSRFSSLSLKDLLEARDLFHYHLLNKKNVVATAIGLYRMRRKDPPDERPKPTPRAPRRTLFNSEIRPDSWPCVYVYVSEWDEEERLSKADPSDVVPRTLYLPDGRTVPVCVIEARKQSFDMDLRVEPRQLVPRNLLGPGAAILNEDGQGMTRVATAGCVVRDGERYYALTNRHALGPIGSVIKAVRGSRSARIGVNSSKGITRESFAEIYPAFMSHHQHLLMDVGLVDLDDITQWKTQFVGIPEPCPVLDLYDNSFDLKLIGMKVVGDSAVSGQIRGEIHGLFYRFKAMGGSEYIADFLIGPETGPHAEEEREEKPNENITFAVHHGDSGTVLFIEHEEIDAHGRTYSPRRFSYYPFSLLWGRNEFIEQGKRLSRPYALATSLSTALDRLNLDLVRDINADQEYIWGWVGHYVIGGMLPVALGLLASPKLKKFVEKNLELLTVTPDDALGNDPKVLKQGATNAAHPRFVQLADVPDNVWKGNVNFYQTEDSNGKKHRVAGPGSRGSADNPNHFADIDLPYQAFTTFLEFNLADPVNHLKPQVWIDYYASVKPMYDAWAAALGEPKPTRQKHWGALPFRVWQLFDAMVVAAGAGNQVDFLVAGGVLIHYIGDACQPLHTSYLSQGDPDRVVDRPHSPGKKMEADGVHAGYEDEMIDYGFLEKSLAALIETEIQRQEADPGETIAAMSNGFEAAKGLLDLIAATRKTLLPGDIVEKWVEFHPLSKAEREEAMWTAFGTQTVECMARGSRYLARFWRDAWTQGHGDTKIGQGAKRTKTEVKSRYNDKNFVPSMALDKYPF
ncbi:MAG TPA: hypothetical protein VFY29_19965 [Terriglobia bacterium]|nr:hypothetical protein [Terriglobia bacterium]